MSRIIYLAKYSPSKVEYEKEGIELLQRFYEIYRYQKKTTFNFENDKQYNSSIKSKAKYFFRVRKCSYCFQ